MIESGGIALVPEAKPKAMHGRWRVIHQRVGRWSEVHSGEPQVQCLLLPEDLGPTARHWIAGTFSHEGDAAPTVPAGVVCHPDLPRTDLVSLNLQFVRDPVTAYPRHA